MAEVVDVGATGEVARSAGHGIVVHSGTAVPDSGALGYSHGCLFVHTDGTTSIDAAYVNAGTKDSASFTPLDASAADGSIAANTISEFTTDTGVTIDGVLVKDTGISNANLTLTSTNELNVLIGTASILAIDDAAIASNVTSGASAFVRCNDAAIATEDEDGDPGGNFTLTAGQGADGGQHTANDPNGGASGCISLVVTAGGAAGSGGSGTAGVSGVIRFSGLTVHKQGAPTAKTTAVTLTAGELLTGILTGTHSEGADQDYTLPTGTLMDAALHSEVGTNEGFYWTLINLSGTPATNTITVAAGTDHTVVGHMVVGDQTPVGRFFTRKTAANTCVTYRVG